MIYIYIKELEKKEEIEVYNFIPKPLKNLILKIFIKMNRVIEKKVAENKKIYIIPNIEKEKVYKKVRKKLEKEKTQTQKVQVILSKKVKKYTKHFEGYKIVEGRDIFINIVEEMLEKTLQGIPLALQDIYILTNSYSEQSITLIKKLALKVKSINIITKEIAKYRNLEEIMQEQGVIICVANNKKKSLKRAKIIININLNKEELNQYTIFRNAMLINITNEKITNLKGFEGLIIQDIEIELQEDEKKFLKQNGLENNFRQLEIYESFKEGKNKEKVKISGVFGNNGKIDEKELRNLQKILTNEKN